MKISLGIIAAVLQASRVFAPLALAIFIIAIVWPLQNRLQAPDAETRGAGNHDRCNDYGMPRFRLDGGLGLRPGKPFAHRGRATIPSALWCLDHVARRSRRIACRIVGRTSQRRVVVAYDTAGRGRVNTTLSFWLIALVS